MITDYEKLMFTTQIEAVITEREAMKAANTERMQREESQAYGEDAFRSLVTDLAGIEAQIRNC
jgi:hypothetical protein